MNKPQFSAAATALVVSLLAGCGGGGGGSGGGSGPAFTCVDGVDSLNCSAAAQRISEAEPVQGSVVQSSNVTMSSTGVPTTNNGVNAVIGRNTALTNTLTYSFDLTGGGMTISISSMETPEADVFNYIPGLDEDKVTLALGSSMVTIIPANFEKAVTVGGARAGTVSLFMITDRSTADATDPDYLAAGYWIYYQESPLSVEIGTFVDSEAEYPAASISGLSSEVRYDGFAIARTSFEDEPAPAPIKLTANFDTNVIDGAIRGPNPTDPRHPDEITVDDFIDRFFLLDAVISTTEAGGFFTGNIDALDNGNVRRRNIGKWGGIFIGTSGTPDKVAGTFAGSHAPSGFRFIGTYLAYEE